MQLIIGTLLDVTDRIREYDGRSWVEHTAHILDGVATKQVTLAGASRDGRDPGLDPALVKSYAGQRVALETYSRTSQNTKNVYLTATKVVTAEDIADALSLTSV